MKIEREAFSERVTFRASDTAEHQSFAETCKPFMSEQKCLLALMRAWMKLSHEERVNLVFLQRFPGETESRKDFPKTPRASVDGKSAR